MTRIKIGVDNGNYNTKSSERLLYASGFTVGTAPSIDSSNQITYNGLYYAIGDKRMNVQNDKTVDDDVFILSLPAIADAMQKAGTNEAGILLGVGLPIGVFGTQKDAFRHYFLRRGIRFEYADQSYCCDIVDCKVFPQGYAALCRYYKLLEKYASVTLTDIGGYTVDVLSVRGGKPDKSSCVSLPLGTIVLFNRIKDTLRQTGIQLTDEQIADAMDGCIQHLKAESINTAIGKHVVQYIKELLNALRERGIDLQLPTVFAGGGAELLGEALSLSDVFTVGTLDRFANAEGYKFLLG